MKEKFVSFREIIAHMRATAGRWHFVGEGFIRFVQTIGCSYCDPDNICPAIGTYHARREHQDLSTMMDVNSIPMNRRCRELVVSAADNNYAHAIMRENQVISRMRTMMLEAMKGN